MPQCVLKDANQALSTSAVPHHHPGVCVCAQSDFPPEGGPFLQAHLATCGRSQHSCTGGARDDCLAVGKDSGDVVAALALDIHEIAVRALNQTLELVLLRLKGCRRVAQIEIKVQNHVCSLSKCKQNTS